jgi:hypothetical protein
MAFWDFLRPNRNKVTPPPQVDKISVPAGRSSRPTWDAVSVYTEIKSKVTFITPGWIADYIPVIRKLSWINPDVGLAVNDMVQLTNTGHKIKFDSGVSTDQQAAMRKHIEDKQEFWGDGVAGMHGIINKLIAQIWISGALCNEWVVANDKRGINHVALINPETIVFQWNKKKLRFFPYQKQNFLTGSILGEKYVKLNTNTVKYFGLNGDTDIPYGIPPYLTALNSLTTQGDMDQNIRFIMKQIGLLGFTQLLMTKPAQSEGESDTQYTAKLNTLLTQAKENILAGITEGVVVGFDEDHEFEFHSTTKNLGGVGDLYNLNEVQVANGLKTAAEFIGAGHAGTETGINIVFTKMLSQLQDVQQIVAANLRHGYTLELRLAGFSFKSLNVEFSPSTITDELKMQQAQEYKVRNVYNKYQMGIIGQQQAADELGYNRPDQAEPRGPISGAGTSSDERQDQNNESDKKIREKKKTQPKKGDSKNIAEFIGTFPEHLINEFLDWYNTK